MLNNLMSHEEDKRPDQSVLVLTWNSLMAVAKAPSASLSRKLVGSSSTSRCGQFHMAAASTSFT